MTKIYPVIMCGGSGTRLWPLSRKAKPKQYHALVGQNSLLQNTVLRLKASNSTHVMPPSFICGHEQGELIKAQCAAAGLDIHRIILEPMGRNTAPAAAVLSILIAQDDPEGLILLLPADHHIEDAQGFWHSVNAGIEVATQGYMTTLGIQPTGPETGFGYICRGERLSDNVYDVESFVEKPDKATAQSYIENGHYFWNAGIFLFAAQALINAFNAHATDILEDCRIAIKSGTIDGPQLLLDTASFKACRSESIDYAIMEHVEKIAVIAPVDIGWNDIGSWSAVQDLNIGTPSDKTIMIDSVGTYIRSEGPMVATIGVENLIIVATEDAVLVTTPDRVQDVKKVVEQLKANKSGLL